jgi:hypothetical protein
MITPTRGWEGFFGLQGDDGRENCAPPRSGLVQRMTFCGGRRDAPEERGIRIS